MESHSRKRTPSGTRSSDDSPGKRERNGNMLPLILDAMMDAVYLINPDFVFEYVNPAAERLFGIVEGRKCFEYFQHRSDPCPWCEKDNIIGGRTVRRTYKEAKTDRVYDVFETPISCPDGKASKLAVLRDVSRRRKAEKSLRLEAARFDALLKLGKMSGTPPEEIASFALDQAVRLTRSRVGFIGFLDGSRTGFTKQIFSKNATRKAQAELPPFVLQRETEARAETAGRRKPPARKRPQNGDGGAGEAASGTANIPRILSIPVVYDGQMSAIAAVANKPDEYDSSDIRQFILLMDGMWKLIRERRDQERLRESEEQMRFLATKLLDFLEDERARLAHEIHENIGQLLAALKFGAEAALKKAGEEDNIQKAMPVLASHVDVLKDAVGKARDMYMNLRPTVLDDFGVISALSWLCARFREGCPQISVDKRLSVKECTIPDKLKLPIFRIVQEALSNAAAHSRADRVVLRLRCKNKALALTFADNGRGFDLDEILTQTYNKRGLGLAVMQERAKLSGGTLSIAAETGHGTKIDASWDLSAEVRSKG